MEIVNGYPCKDCTDVSYAKKNIDPAHPKEAAEESTKAKDSQKRDVAVEFGGALAALNGLNGSTPSAQNDQQRGTSAVGSRVSLVA